MIEMIATGLGWILIAAGSFFIVIAGIGLVRFPDVYTRMHAAGITDTAAAALMLIGMALVAGFSLVAAKLLIILGVILFTSPVGTHALAQAALHAGIEPILASPPKKKAPPRNAAKRRPAKNGGSSSKT